MAEVPRLLKTGECELRTDSDGDIVVAGELDSRHRHGDGCGEMVVVIDEGGWLSEDESAVFKRSRGLEELSVVA